MLFVRHTILSHPTKMSKVGSCEIPEHQEAQDEPESMCPSLSRDTTLDHWEPGTQSCLHLKLLKQVETLASSLSHREDRESLCVLQPQLRAWIWTGTWAAGYLTAAASSCHVMSQRLGGALDVLGSPGPSPLPAE